MKIIIRNATLDDYDDVLSLFIEQNKFNAILAPDELCQTNDLLTQPELKDLISDEQTCLLVAENDKHLCGLLLGNIANISGKRWIKPRRYGYIEELVVFNRYRRKGIANKLFKYFEEWVNQQGINNIELHIWSNNIEAEEFYDKMGFRVKQLKMVKTLS